MFWRKQPKPSIETHAKEVVQHPLPQLTVEANIAKAILDYQRSFSESLRHHASADVENAKRVVARANQIGESRLGPALVPTLLDHVKYWPSWSKRGDFREHVRFTAEDISGAKETNEADRTDTTRVRFSYHGNTYTVVFVDKGMPRWTTNDSNAYGKVELIYQGYSVLGLDISQDLSKEHSAWRWHNVFAFLPGSWMKDLIEMAAYIEEGQNRILEGYTEKDALERAGRIKL